MSTAPTLRFSKAVIATGARAAVPPIPGLAEAGFLTNHNVFNLTETTPDGWRLSAAGPSAANLPRPSRGSGSEVTIIEMADQFLQREDRDAAEVLQKSLLPTGSGFDSRRGWRGSGSTMLQNSSFLAGPGGKEQLEVDKILVGVGRTPNVEGLNLEAAGVALRSAAASPWTTHSDHQSADLLRPATSACPTNSPTRPTRPRGPSSRTPSFRGPRRQLSALEISWCTYTDPEIAHVGLYPRRGRRKRGSPSRRGRFR